jgi:hypothetical protein
LTYLERHKSYGPDKLRWKEAEEAEAEEAEENFRLKQYVSLRSEILVPFRLLFEIE